MCLPAHGIELAEADDDAILCFVFLKNQKNQ